MFESKIYKQRRENLRKLLGNGVAIFLSNNESPMNYPGNTFHYRQDSSFLYFFGIDQPGYIGVVDADNNCDVLYGNDLDMDDIIWMGPQPSVREMASKVGVDQTKEFSAIHTLIEKAKGQNIQVHYLPPYRPDNKIFLNELLGISINQLKEKASVSLIKAVVELRSVKDELEIAQIDQACNVGYLMHTTAMKMAKPGVYEREISGFIEGIALQHGGIPSFPVILSVNGQTLHNHYHGNQLKEGRMMIVDAGFENPMHYASDNTRCVPVGGKFNQRQREIYQIVLDANNISAAMTAPGIAYRDCHFAACKTIASGLSQLGLMKGNVDEAVALGAHALFMPHGLGHMMGLDVHDMEDLGENYVGYDNEYTRSEIFGTAFLRLAKRLKPGYVITNEPGIYFIPELISQWKTEGKFKEFINYDKVEQYLDFGGIRLEDDILITENGKRLLGDRRVPITIEEVENLF